MPLRLPHLPQQGMLGSAVGQGLGEVVEAFGHHVVAIEQQRPVAPQQAPTGGQTRGTLNQPRKAFQTAF